VHDPATNRRLLFENCDNHENCWLQHRGLSARFIGAVEGSQLQHAAFKDYLIGIGTVK